MNAVPLHKIGFEQLFNFEGQTYRKCAMKDGGTVEVGFLLDEKGEADPEQRLELPRATIVGTVEGEEASEETPETAPEETPEPTPKPRRRK